MKALKIALLSILSIFVVVYFSFLFILPYSVDLNQYSPQLTNAIEQATGFKVQIKGLKVKTAWNLSGGAIIEKTDLSYPKTIQNGEKFAQINNLEVKLSLLPLFVGKIKLDSIDAEKVICNLKVEKSGNFLLEKALLNIDKNGSKKVEKKTEPLPFNMQFSTSMPDVSVDKYKIAFIDMPTGKIYAIKGSDFKISDFVLEKKIKVKALGEVILDNRKQISYDVSVFSKVLPSIAEQKSPSKTQEFNFMQIFEDLYKYNMCANIKSSLKITGKPDDADIKGDLNIDKIAFTLGGKTLPKSDLALKFKGDKVKISSNFYTDTTEKAVITGVFNNGKKKFIDLRVLSDGTDIGNLFLISNNILQMAGINDLNGITANGVINADFKIKSDFKKIESNGFLKINNASITDKLYNASLKSIFADIDFSNDAVRIKKSSALLDGKPLSVTGSIDANANANLDVAAKNLSLKGLLATLGQMQVLKENDINSGLINIDATLKGRLDKAIPTIDVVLSNLSLKNKPNNVYVKVAAAKIKMVSNGKKTNGKIEVKGIAVTPKGLKTIQMPKMGLTFDEKDLNIADSAFYMNTSKVNVFGSVKNYQSKNPKADITARGLIYAMDIKSMLPKSNQAGVSAVGKIPLLVRITGDGKYDINAQMLANKTNHLALFDIDTLKGRTSLLSAQLLLNGDNLHIKEIALYALRANKGLSQNMKENLSFGTKVATIIGKVSDINSVNPVLRGVGISIPNQLSTSIPGFVGSKAYIKGDLSLEGSLNNPDIGGYLTLPSVSIPTLKTNLKNLIVHFDKKIISTNCPQVSVADSLMGFNAVIINNFSNGIVIKNVEYVSSFLNLDSLGAAFSNMPQNANGPGTDLGVVILGGKGEVAKFKTGGLVATNVTTDIGLKNNWLNLDNVRADAYLGKIGGNIKYNLIYGNTKINIQGRNLSAGPAIKGLTGMPEAMSGQLGFDSNISMTGATQSQILHSLKGDTDFVITNGKMGKLGKLEHLLYAQNILSNNVFRATLNVIAKALTVKNTGFYKYIKGTMTFSNGWANISAIKSSGPSMSMYVTGRYNLLDNSANMVVLGRLSNDIVQVLGPIGDLSVDKVLSFIPKIGTITAALIGQMTTNPYYEDISMIPDLTPKTTLPTKEFKVVINGDVGKQSSVKSFKWLATPHAANTSSSSSGDSSPVNIHKSVQEARTQIQSGAKQILNQVNTATPTRYVPPKKIIAPVADFINGLPDLK